MLTSQNEYDICDDRDVGDMCKENRLTKMDYALGHGFIGSLDLKWQLKNW